MKYQKSEILEYLSNGELRYDNIQSDFENDKDIAEVAILMNPMNVEYFVEDLKNDYCLMELAISKNANAYEYIGKELEDNQYLAKIAVCGNEEMLYFVSETIKHSRDFLEFCQENIAQDIFVNKFPLEYEKLQEYKRIDRQNVLNEKIENMSSNVKVKPKKRI